MPLRSPSYFLFEEDCVPKACARLLVLFILSTFAACGGGGGGVEDTTSIETSGIEPRLESSGNEVFVQLQSDSPRSAISFTGTADGGGIAKISIALEGANALQLVTTSGASTATLSFHGPSGALVSSTDEPLKTTASALDVFVNSFPYPTKGSDPALENGQYEQTLFFDPPNSAFQGQALFKRDGNLSAGSLRVNLHFVGSIAYDGEARASVDKAVRIWRSIFASAGISLDLRYFEIPGESGILPSPLLGSAFYAAQGAAPGVWPMALNVYVGESISDSTGGANGSVLDGVLGLSPSVPGPAIASIKSAVALSVLVHAGPDGSFDDRERQVLGESFAHESGHYLGLFHPVEIAGRGTYRGRDPLGDTPICRSDADCIQDGTAENVMFPRPLADIEQNKLTAQQTEVLNLQVLVD